MISNLEYWERRDKETKECPKCKSPMIKHFSLFWECMNLDCFTHLNLKGEIIK